MPNQYVAKSRRLRSTIYSSRIENQGVTSYTIYNHMLLPCLLYTSPSPRDRTRSRMPSSA